MRKVVLSCLKSSLVLVLMLFKIVSKEDIKGQKEVRELSSGEEGGKISKKRQSLNLGKIFSVPVSKNLSQVLSCLRKQVKDYISEKIFIIRRLLET